MLHFIRRVKLDRKSRPGFSASTACPRLALAEPISFKVPLSGGQEVPAVHPAGAGLAEVTGSFPRPGPARQERSCIDLAEQTRGGGRKAVKALGRTLAAADRQLTPQAPERQRRLLPPIGPR